MSHIERERVEESVGGNYLVVVMINDDGPFFYFFSFTFLSFTFGVAFIYFFVLYPREVVWKDVGEKKRD